VCVWFKTKFLAGNFLFVIGWFSGHTHTYVFCDFPLVFDIGRHIVTGRILIWRG